MDKATAIAELSAMLKWHSDGYYTHLANGGKINPAEEKELDALDFAIKYMQEEEPVGRCDYCQEDRDGYVCRLPRQGKGNAALLSSFGKKYMYVRGPYRVEFRVEINYCPMCGRKLKRGAEDG